MGERNLRDGEPGQNLGLGDDGEAAGVPVFGQPVAP